MLALPGPFLDLVCDANAEQGVEDEQADMLHDRLCEHVKGNVTLVYLSPKQEWQVTRCCVELVVAAMRKGSSFDHALEIEQSGPIVVSAFVKGSAGAFFQDRGTIVDALSDDLDVPFLPQSWKRAICARVVDAIASLLEKGILDSFGASRGVVEASADAAAAAASAALKAQRLPEDTSVEGCRLQRKARAASLLAEELAGKEEAQMSEAFDQRVRETLVQDVLKQRLPSLASSASAVRVARQAVDLALNSSFDADLMNNAVAYLLDQHRTARRLRGVPRGARELLLRKKEEVLGAVLDMDADGDGEVTYDEFSQGVRLLGLALTEQDARSLFSALDTDDSGALDPVELEVMLYGRALTEERRREMRDVASRQRRHRTSKERGEAPAREVGTRGLLLQLLPIVFGRQEPAQQP